MMWGKLMSAGRMKAAATIGGALLVASCGPLISFGDTGPADETYSLKYPASLSETASSGPAIYLDSPRMVNDLDQKSIAVRLDGNQRTVLEGAAWSQHLSDIVRDYVAHAAAAKADVNIVSEGGLDIAVGCRLGVKVWAMEFVPGNTRRDDNVEVALQFSLVKLSTSELLGHPTFTESVPVATASGRAVVDAFSSAMENAAGKYGAWLQEASTACHK
jgi:ABC-type uncharacterized transport system auxiliary subunit